MRDSLPVLVIRGKILSQCLRRGGANDFMTRIDALLDLLEKRPQITADEAHKIVDVAESDETAERSVVLVEKVLLRHPEMFKSFERTVRESERDKEGRDIDVHLRRKNSFAGFRDFSIEVKSSPGGIDEFRHNLTDGTARRVRKFRVDVLGLEGAIDEYLYEKRIIVLDASRFDLDAVLTKEFGLLRQHWKDKMKGSFAHGVKCQG